MAPLIKKVVETLVLSGALNLVTWVSNLIYRIRRRLNIQAKNRQLRENNEQAKTKEERDAAARGLIDHFDK